jgi:hypothetical protein
MKRANYGCSTGTVQNNGTLKIKNGGLKDKIVEGHQFENGKKIFLASTNENRGY